MADIQHDAKPDGASVPPAIAIATKKPSAEPVIYLTRAGAPVAEWKLTAGAKPPPCGNTTVSCVKAKPLPRASVRSTPVSHF